MYKYKVGYYSWEDSRYFELENEIKYCKCEFDKICRNAVIEAAKLELGKKEITIHLNDMGFNFQSLIPAFIQIMLGNGFKLIEYDGIYTMNGWNSLCVPSSNAIREDEESEVVESMIPQEIKNMAIKIGKSEMDKMYEKYRFKHDCPTNQGNETHGK